MKQGKDNFKRWIQTNILLLVVFASVLVIFLSLVLNIRYTQLLTQLIYKVENENLNRLKREYDDIADSLAKVTYILGHNSQVNDFFIKQESLTWREFNLIKEIVNRETTTFSYVDSVYLLNTEGKSFYIPNNALSSGIIFENKNLDDQQIFDILDDFGTYRYNQPLLRIVKVTGRINDSPEEKFILTHIFSPQPLPVNRLAYAVAANIPMEKITELLGGISSQAVFLIAQNGMITGSNDHWRFPPMKDVSSLVDMSRIHSATTDQGYYIESHFAEQTFMVWRKDSARDRLYIIAIPYSRIMGQLNNLTRGILIICVIILLGSITLAFFLSIKINAPMRKLNQSVQDFQRKAVSDGILLKQELLRRILHDEAAGSISGENEHFKVDLYRVRAVMILEFENEEESGDKIHDISGGGGGVCSLALVQR